MPNMSISLSEKMRDFVKARVKSGDYNNESEFVRDLIRRHMERAEAEAELIAHLQKAEASGVSDKTPEDVRREILAKYQQSAA